MCNKTSPNDSTKQTLKMKTPALLAFNEPKKAHVTPLFISLLATGSGLHQVHACLLTEQPQAPYPPTFTQD